MKSIPLFPKYSVTKEGKIYSHHRNRHMKLKTTAQGYLVVNLKKLNKKSKQKRVHKLVAQVYISNPHKYKLVNHIDGNKQNNNVNNLEWCNGSHNTRHSFKNKLQINKKMSVEKFDINENNIVCKYESISGAANQNNTTVSSIRYACNNNSIHRGYKWRYTNKQNFKVDTTSWKILMSFPAYKISRNEEIYSIKHKKIMRSSKQTGYFRLGVYDVTGKRKKMLVHRLVAMAYVPNPNKYNYVNHIDKNKLNNSFDNLEWSTHKNNIIHSCSKIIVQSNLSGIEIRRYSCIADAAKAISSSRNPISVACRKNGVFKNFKWKYLDTQ